MTRKTAFSLIELSLAIIIVGILIAGIASTKTILQKSRLAAAGSLTKNSKIDEIEGLVTWLETTLPQSFLENEAQQEVDLDGNSLFDGISVWHDIQNSFPTKHNATQTTSNNRPLYYSNCINSLPCVRFNGSNQYMSINMSGLINHDYTIFIIEQKRTGSGTSMAIIGISTAPAIDNSLALGYYTDTAGMFSQGDLSNFYTFGTSPTIPPYSASGPVGRLHVFVNPKLKTGSNTVYHYLNGYSTASTLGLVGAPSFSTLTNYENGTLGSENGGYYFNGDIGEIIIYNRALDTNEREAVENYLLKKWKITSL